MIRNWILLFGIVAVFATAMVGLTILPKMVVDPRAEEPDYANTFEIVKGHEIYVREGCIYCHSQQVRPQGFGADFDRGWGRASEAEDYRQLTPHNLGTMRTGPDLSNIGERQPSEDWHLINLYQPRALNDHTIMPPFPWLFEVISENARPNEEGLRLPERYRIPGKKIVPTEEAKYLVAYLLSLDQNPPGVEVSN
jgi:cytochrome c oxidase cbb3-type subunit 2